MLDRLLLAFARASAMAQAEFSVLDLNCDRGQVAKLLRPVADRIDGIVGSPERFFELRELYDDVTLSSMETLTQNELDEHWFVVGVNVLERLPVQEAQRLLKMLRTAHCLSYFEIDHAPRLPLCDGSNYPGLEEIWSGPENGCYVQWP